MSSPLSHAADETPLVRADFGYASKYVFRGIERAGASAQATVEFARDGWRGGFRTNLPFDGGSERELAANAAYTWQPAKGLTLEASVANYTHSQVAPGGTKHSWEAGIAATLAPISGYKPSFAYSRDLRLQADTVEVALAHSVALPKFGAYLDFSLFAGWATGDDWRPDAPGPARHDSYRYWGASAQLPYRVGPHSTVVAGVHFADTGGLSPTNGPFARSARGNFRVTLGVSLDF